MTTASQAQVWIDQLSGAYVGAVYDVLRELGIGHCTLPKEISGLLPDATLIGPAFTVSGQRVTLSAHETLLQWTGFLSKAPAGSVVVCQPNDHELAHMGELSAETLFKRGVRGYLVDGGSRDTAYVRRIGFPVFCRYQTPADIVGRWTPTAFAEPVQIGHVTIREGDFVFADLDGGLVIPRGRVAEVARRVSEVVNTENKVRKAILSGADPQQAYLTHGLF
jgi:4-hydroxy-4-methyl-2-oxoglutarate aldolase